MVAGWHCESERSESGATTISMGRTTGQEIEAEPLLETLAIMTFDQTTATEFHFVVMALGVHYPNSKNPRRRSR